MFTVKTVFCPWLFVWWGWMYSATSGFLISITSRYKIIINNPRCHGLTCTSLYVWSSIMDRTTEQHRVGRSGCRLAFLHSFKLHHGLQRLHVCIHFEKPNPRMSGSNQSRHYTLPAWSVHFFKHITLNIVQCCFFFSFVRLEYPADISLKWFQLTAFHLLNSGSLVYDALFRPLQFPSVPHSECR